MNIMPLNLNFSSLADKAKLSRNGNSTFNYVSYTFKSIEGLANDVFDGFCAVLSFPTRYIGAKTWSIPGAISRIPMALFNRTFKNSKGSLSQSIFCTSEHYNTKPTALSTKDTPAYLPYIFSIMAGHNTDLSWTNPFKLRLMNPTELNISIDSLPKGMQIKENCFFDPTTGLKVAMFERNGEVIITFGALRSYESEIDRSETRTLMHKMQFITIQNLVGLKPGIYNEANEFVSVIKNSKTLKNKKIVLTGQCFGGALAAYVGTQQEIQTLCFNSVPLGAGLQQDIGEKKLLRAHKYVTHISAKGDYMSNLAILRPLDKIVSLVGIRTPGCFGKHYEVPTAYKNYAQTHIFMAGSMMQHIGYNNRTKPCELSPSNPIFHI